MLIPKSLITLHYLVHTAGYFYQTVDSIELYYIEITVCLLYITELGRVLEHLELVLLYVIYFDLDHGVGQESCHAPGAYEVSGSCHE